MEIWPLDWSHGRAKVYATGAALHALAFDIGGRGFAPLAEAPWQTDYITAPDPAMPRHLQLLGGEWPCVPFGTTRHDPAHQGFGTDDDWRLLARGADWLRLTIDYPEASPVRRLVRELRGVPGKPRLDISLRIDVRDDCILPVGLHPIFRLSDDLRLEAPGFEYGRSFPRIFEPGRSVLPANAAVEHDGRIDDFGNLFETPAKGREELLQLFHCDGAMTLHYRSEAAKAHLRWDSAALPHCLLWVSNHGRDAAPWNGRFRGLGVEPVNSYFDINDAGPDTAAIGLTLRRDRPKDIRYSLSAEAA